MTLQARVRADLSGSSITRGSGIGRVTGKVGGVWSVPLEDGVDADEADQVYTLENQTIADDDELLVDLRGGGLLDPLGAAFGPAKLRVILIASRRTNTTPLTLFGDPASVPVLSDAAATVTLNPGCMFLLVDRSSTGIPVTPTTGDILRIANGLGADAKVDLVLIGTSS